MGRKCYKNYFNSSITGRGFPACFSKYGGINTMCVTVYNRQEKEKACAFYELVKKLHDIFNLEYHETKDGSRAYDKVVGFVELHQEYKPAFDSIYN